MADSPGCFCLGKSEREFWEGSGTTTGSLITMGSPLKLGNHIRLSCGIILAGGQGLRKIGIIASNLTEMDAAVILNEGEERNVKAEDLVLVRNRNGNTLAIRRDNNLKPKVHKMTYEEFRDKIAELLKSEPSGLSWTTGRPAVELRNLTCSGDRLVGLRCRYDPCKYAAGYVHVCALLLWGSKEQKKAFVLRALSSRESTKLIPTAKDATRLCLTILPSSVLSYAAR